MLQGAVRAFCAANSFILGALPVTEPERDAILYVWRVCGLRSNG